MKPTLLLVLAAATPLLAQAPRQAHWRSEMSGPGAPAGLTAENWIKGDRVRTEMETPLGPSVMVVKGGMAYIKTGPMAVKMAVDQQGNAAARPGDYAKGLEELLKGGEKLGKETIDGEVCDKWKVARKEGDESVESVLWISPSLKFPRQIQVTSSRGEVLMHNREIDVTANLDDRLFEPEPGVDYQDVNEVMKRLSGQKPQ